MFLETSGTSLVLPSSRAPATAVGLAIPYLIAVVWSLSK
jgi:hypothetical protein